MNPKSKFCVGEEVMIRCEQDISANIDRTEIIDMAYTPTINAITGERVEAMWCYRTDCDEIAFGEPALRKLPPEDRTQWSDCAWMPKETVK